MTARLAQGDPSRMARLIETGVAPLPASAAEWQDYRRLTAIAPAPATSVNMCAACAGDDASPAASLARNYAALAAAAAYPRPDLNHARPIDPYPHRQSRAAGRADPLRRRGRSRHEHVGDRVEELCRARPELPLRQHQGPSRLARGGADRRQPQEMGDRARRRGEGRGRDAGRAHRPSGSDRRRPARGRALQGGRDDRRRGRSRAHPGDVDVGKGPGALHRCRHVHHQGSRDRHPQHVVPPRPDRRARPHRLPHLSAPGLQDLRDVRRARQADGGGDGDRRASAHRLRGGVRCAPTAPTS